MISKTVPQVKKRPRGITIIALYNCLSGICTTTLLVIIIISLTSSGNNVSFDITTTLWGIWGFVNILLFWGLWNKRPWAIWSTISVQLVVLSYIWFWGPRGISADASVQIVYSIIPSIILFYLSFVWEKKPSNLYP
jgi:hypothetical protein